MQRACENRGKPKGAFVNRAKLTEIMLVQELNTVKDPSALLSIYNNGIFNSLGVLQLCSYIFLLSEEYLRNYQHWMIEGGDGEIIPKVGN